MRSRNRSLLTLFVFFLAFSIPSYSQDLTYDEIVNIYIDRFKDVSIRKMQEYGIPASITLAQGILESNAGRSDLAIEANNHFGIKCHKEWTGKRYYKDDDKPDECFRKYADPMESYQDHSLFLTSRERYKGLFSLPRDDYRGWAEGLKAAGYATNPKYAEMLIKMIERFGLNKYDHPESLVLHSKPGVNDSIRGEIVSDPFRYFAPGPDGRKVYMNNHCLLVMARSENDLASISAAFDIPVETLRQYNDLKPGMKVREGDPVYLQKKKNKGIISTHTVVKGQSLWDIAQLCGMTLGKLARKNHLQHGRDPVPGMVLKLR